jgi:hypothetical protein
MSMGAQSWRKSPQKPGNPRQGVLTPLPPPTLGNVSLSSHALQTVHTSCHHKEYLLSFLLRMTNVLSPLQTVRSRVMTIPIVLSFHDSGQQQISQITMTEHVGCYVCNFIQRTRLLCSSVCLVSATFSYVQVTNQRFPKFYSLLPP